MRFWTPRERGNRRGGLRIPFEVPRNISIQAARKFGWASTNWSGYAVSSSTQGAYDSVSGSWVVPAVGPSGGSKPTSFWARTWKSILRLLGIVSSGSDGYSASWIGIDGFNNSSLIQTGTAQNYVNGQAQYYAWWEILPSPETVISQTQYPVTPGDNMQAEIAKQADGTWTIQLKDLSKGWTFTRSGIHYSGPQTSAEWIEEAPEVGTTVAVLANYGETTFGNCAVNGRNPALTEADGGVMYHNNQIVSTPSLPGPNGNDFNVAYGSTIPSAPSS